MRIDGFSLNRERDKIAEHYCDSKRIEMNTSWPDGGRMKGKNITINY
jgi:hypothetical protein